MPRLTEITSTEKLLEVIRKKNAAAVDGANRLPGRDTFGPGVSGGIKKFFPAAFPYLRRPITIGVDIAPGHLRLVKIRKRTANHWKLLQHKSVRFPPLMSRESKDFPDFLKSELTKFCGAAKLLNIWSRIPASSIEINHIHIPKVEKKQLENAVYWTMKKEASFDEQESILDFKVLGELAEQGGVAKLHVMAYTTSRAEVTALKKLFETIGFPLTGISAIPFAILNLLRTEWPVPYEETFADLFIGNDFSRIDIYHGGNLVMGRDIKAGLNSMAEALMEGYQQKYRDKSALNADSARNVIFSRLSDEPDPAIPDSGIDITPDEVFAMILPAVERLVRQVERTFERFMATTEIVTIKKIYISSFMNSSRRIVEYIGTQLGIERDVHDPSQALFLSGERDAGVPTISERSALVPALGLALSNNAHTPNFLFTHKDKETAAVISLANRTILAVFLIAITLCSITLLYYRYMLHQKDVARTVLEKQLAGYRTKEDHNSVLQLVSQMKQQRQLSRAYGERYLAMAVISELSVVTPREINLISMKAHLGKASPDKNSLSGREPTRDAPKPQEKEITVEGLIFGKRESTEALLTGYVIKLDGSPLFRHVNVQKSSFESFNKGELLHFIINAKIG